MQYITYLELQCKKSLSLKISLVEKLLIVLVVTKNEHKLQCFPQLLAKHPIGSETSTVGLNLEGDKISFRFLPLLADPN